MYTYIVKVNGVGNNNLSITKITQNNAQNNANWQSCYNEIWNTNASATVSFEIPSLAAFGCIYILLIQQTGDIYI